MCRTVFKLRAFLSVGYQIIYADPPWEFRNYNNKTAEKWVGEIYPLMTTQDICKLNVRELADENAILFIWGTWPKLPDVLRVLRAWGFEYRTVGFVWIKTNKRKQVAQGAFFPDESFDEFLGMGYWTRSNTEFCLIGMRGKVKRISNDVRQIIYSPIQEHSRKPNEAKERIVRLFGDLPRVELFARRPSAGWDVWGNEVQSAEQASNLMYGT